MYKHSDKIVTFIPPENIEAAALGQIENTAKLPFLFKHVAVMPDTHYGKGSTVGTVIATKGAICPAAVGVDIGCGMIAVRTNLKREQFTDLPKLRSSIERSVPMSAGKFNQKISESAQKRIDELTALAGDIDMDKKFGTNNWKYQLGTLGGGNHFIELCVDETDTIWVTLHSGSRGIGNKIGMYYIGKAQELCKKMFVQLPDEDLAYLVEGSEEFDNYQRDLHWAQKFALLNREEMMDNVLKDISYVLYGENGHQKEFEVERINCHHNFTQKESVCSTCIDNLGNDNHLYEHLLADGVVSKLQDFLDGYRPFFHSCGGLLLSKGVSVLKPSPSQVDALEQIHDALHSLIPELVEKRNHSESVYRCECASSGQIDESYYTALSKSDLSFSRLFGVGKDPRILDRILGHIFFGVGTYNLDCELNKHLHSITPVWITRKGAIEATEGKLAMIPGSMGTRSYIVSGLGCKMSFNSAPHGAGRRFSRGEARKRYTMDDFDKAMVGIEHRRTDVLLDEIPQAYKDIDEVMENAKELVEIKYTLKQILNCKGD